MGRKLRHVLIFLLIILKEPYMPEAPCLRRTRNPPLGRNPGPGVVGSNTNTAVSVMASGHDHQYEDIENNHDSTGQGQHQTNANTATVMTSGHDQTGQGQSQAITRSLDVSNLSYGTDLTASQQSALYKDVTQCHATTDTAIVMTSGHDQTGQGQYQAITETLDARNLSYGTGPTATQQISLNEAISNSQTITNTAFVMTSGHDQTGQGQYQAITESLDTRNLSRLEPKNRKDRGHPVANLAARPSATSDNVNKHPLRAPAANRPESIEHISGPPYEPRAFGARLAPTALAGPGPSDSGKNHVIC
ncbi:Bax inhibitor 1 [Branchiostoma belcheri]|nr:Bax inhibitor 1 [Branchiostoma belcheri]